MTRITSHLPRLFGRAWHEKINPAEFVKQKILGTALGRLLVSTRDVLQIVDMALRSPEDVGSLINDLIASRLVCELCSPTKVFVDVGAHIGSVTDRVLRHNSSISVIAIEAIPAKAIALKRKFPNVTVHECAAGEREGSALFHINTKESGYSSLARQEDSAFINVINVQIQTLDKLIANENVDVIKIDVEGAELGVIRGAKRLISECRPILMFESAPGETLGYTKDALWHNLAEQEYDIVLPNRVAHLGPGLTLDGFTESHLYPSRSTNYFGIPRERRDEVRRHARQLQGVPTDSKVVKTVRA